MQSMVLYVIYLDITPPMANGDENKRPLPAKNHTGKKSVAPSSTTRQTQYRILPRGQPDELPPSIKKPESNNHNNNTPEKTQRNRREFSMIFISKKKASTINDFYY
jgi:hypothetical protein